MAGRCTHLSHYSVQVKQFIPYFIINCKDVYPFRLFCICTSFSLCVLSIIFYLRTVRMLKIPWSLNGESGKVISINSWLLPQWLKQFPWPKHISPTWQEILLWHIASCSFRRKATIHPGGDCILKNQIFSLWGIVELNALTDTYYLLLA